MTRWNAWAVAALCACSAGASAQFGGGGQTIGISYGIYFPQDSEIRGIFGSNITRTGISLRGRPSYRTEWRVTNDIGYITASSPGSRFTLIPITVGAERHFGEEGEAVRPFVRIAGGLAYYDYSILRSEGEGTSRFASQRIGATASLEAGTHLTDRIRLSARYHWFQSAHGFNFSGIEVAASVGFLGL
jgi:hypothetical protein